MTQGPTGWGWGWGGGGRGVMQEAGGGVGWEGE